MIDVGSKRFNVSLIRTPPWNHKSYCQYGILYQKPQKRLFCYLRYASKHPWLCMRIIYHLLNQIQMPLDTAAFHEEMEENFSWWIALYSWGLWSSVDWHFMKYVFWEGSNSNHHRVDQIWYLDRKDFLGLQMLAFDQQKFVAQFIFGSLCSKLALCKTDWDNGTGMARRYWKIPSESWEVCNTSRCSEPLPLPLWYRKKYVSKSLPIGQAKLRSPLNLQNYSTSFGQQCPL